MAEEVNRRESDGAVLKLIAMTTVAFIAIGMVIWFVV